LYPQKCAFLIVIEKLLYKHYRNRIRKKLDMMCTTQICHKNMCFHVSAGRHRFAYVMYKYFNVLEWAGNLEESSSRERIYSCIRLFREGSCGVAERSIIGDTYGAQTYVDSAYWCVSQRT